MSDQSYAGQAAGVIVALAMIYLMADVMRSNRDELIVMKKMITDMQAQIEDCKKD